MYIYSYTLCNQQLGNGTVFGVRWTGYMKCRVDKEMVIQNEAMRHLYPFSDFVLIWTVIWTG